MLIVNDIAGHGKVAGNVNIPIVSAAQFEPTILPTLILSTNADFHRGAPVTREMEDAFGKMLQHFEDAEIPFSSYSTGYFANAEQIDTFIAFYRRQMEHNPDAKLFVDPIMGDGGSAYPGFNDEVIKKLGELVGESDVSMPNLTEACLMTGFSYSESMTSDQLHELAEAVHNLGARNVVITGVEDEERFGPDQIGFYSYNEAGDANYHMHKKTHQHFFGTGDMAISLTAAFYQTGCSLNESLELAGEFIEIALADTVMLERNYQFGIYFEPMMGKLSQKITELREQNNI